MAKKRHYQALGLESDATSEQVAEAFTRLAIPQHPDTNSSEESSSQFYKPNEAYLAIIKADKDSAYKDYIAGIELRENMCSMTMDISFTQLLV